MKRGGNYKPTIIRERGKFELNAISNTSSSGLFNVNTYAISTAICQRWQALALLYQRWRIRKLRLTYFSQISTTYNGRVAIAINEDPDAGTPTSFRDMMELESCQECSGYARKSVTFTPNNATRWLFTQDLSLNEDRLEQPGNLYVATGSFTSAIVPGYVILEYDTEWVSPCTSNTSIFRTKEVYTDVRDELQQLIKLKTEIEGQLARNGLSNLSKV